jgi:hypothetical protein
MQARGENMRRIFAVLTIVCAFTFLSAAQTGGAPGSTDHPAGGNAQTGGDEHAMHKKGGGGSTLTGCLSGPNDEGVYELKSGKRTVEVGGLEDLSKHVGHEVKLHGSWTKSGSEIGEKENEAAEKKEGTESKEGKEEKGERHFKVSSIDHMSDTCKAGAAMGGHHKKGSGTSQPSTPPKP